MIYYLNLSNTYCNPHLPLDLKNGILALNDIESTINSKGEQDNIPESTQKADDISIDKSSIPENNTITIMQGAHAARMHKAPSPQHSTPKRDIINTTITPKMQQYTIKVPKAILLTMT